MQTIWAKLALITIKFARNRTMYRVSNYCAAKAGFFGA